MELDNLANLLVWLWPSIRNQDRIKLLFLIERKEKTTFAEMQKEMNLNKTDLDHRINRIEKSIFNLFKKRPLRINDGWP
jgi:predicted transcriptional regulator